MNSKQVEKFTLRYLEALDCRIIEKGPGYVTVKLSPEADKDLTYRPYYWNFVERTGAAPETMTFTFIFDPEKYPQQEGAVRPTAEAPSDSILGRYFGVTLPSSSGRVLKEEIAYGSRRLEQIYASVKTKGKYTTLYEFHTDSPSRPPSFYHTWFAVNLKVGFVCDMKRDEIHSLGICLNSGEIMESFQDLLTGKKLSPRLPTGITVKPGILSVEKALLKLEEYLFRIVKKYDHTWAVEAARRLQDELHRVESYYKNLLESDADEEQKRQIAAQQNNRVAEIHWQYRPRVTVTAVNCGIFHLHPNEKSV